jgi:hypothetical protein
MGRTATRLGVLGAALLIVFLGCKHDNNLKPPKHDPEFNLPPNDPRYSQYPKFPDSTLNQFPKRDPSAAEGPNPGGPSRFGMGGPGGPQH